jgi:CelD/BcsL family acetyltransferase involved in cellulose biosynthesis
MLGLRSLWQSLCAARPGTIFQDFDLNALAAETFAEREEPVVISAESSHGAAIIPAALWRHQRALRLLGEELFDYRSFLHQGDDEPLLVALDVAAELRRDIEILALREPDLSSVPEGLPLLPFSAAPATLRSQIGAEEFQANHNRLARNLRRLQRLGFELGVYDGANSRLLRSIYARKADQQENSLFHDPLRVQFMVAAGQLVLERMQIFTLERNGKLGAALVTLLDRGVRRFYTIWFAPEIAAHSPALTLIFEIARQSLAAGLDCDYMTGEQDYKLRLATSSVPLYRLKATTGQLAAAAANTPAVRIAA